MKKKNMVPNHTMVPNYLTWYIARYPKAGIKMVCKIRPSLGPPPSDYARPGKTTTPGGLSRCYGKEVEGLLKPLSQCETPETPQLNGGLSYLIDCNPIMPRSFSFSDSQCKHFPVWHYCNIFLVDLNNFGSVPNQSEKCNKKSSFG